MWKESWLQYVQESINIKKQIGHIKTTLIDINENVYIYKKLVTASRFMILTYEMSMNERFNMIGLTSLFPLLAFWENLSNITYNRVIFFEILMLTLDKRSKKQSFNDKGAVNYEKHVLVMKTYYITNSYQYRPVCNYVCGTLKQFIHL